MQSIKYLSNWLQDNANNEHYLFTSQDMRCLFPDLSKEAFKVLLSRAVKSGLLTRVCRGLYLYKRAMPFNGLLLFHIAAQARINSFNYISLETALSDVGIISQIPINWITIMTSGRSNLISCGEFGTIEFVHTSQKPIEVMNHLVYDADCKFWRADSTLALKDMRRSRRNLDLIDWEVANEFV